MADTETPETEAEEIPATETPETIPDPEAKTESSAEATTETEPTETEKAKEWDKDRQKRAEERAAREKARDEEIAGLKATVEELKKAKTPPAPAAPTATELQAMADDVEALTDPASDKYDLDAARKVEVKLRKATLERQQALDERLRIQEAREAESSAETRWWTKWKEDHADCDQIKAKAIVDAGFSKFSKSYNGAALGVRVAEELDNRLEETRKKSPPPRVAPKTPTAPASSASPPAGTQVVPQVSGARPKPVQIKEVEGVLGKAMRALRGG